RRCRWRGRRRGAPRWPPPPAPSAALDHHGESHPSLRADRQEAELHVPPGHFVRERGDEPGAGRAERMADGNGAAHHVDDVLVDLPAFGGPTLEVRKHLRRKRLMHLDQAELFPLDARPLERLGDGEDGRLQQLAPRVHRRARAEREMWFSLAISSADWPIDSPVEGSAMAGDTGTRSRGRIRLRVRRRAPSDFALFASTRMSARRREARIGISESDSTPPASTTSASPSTISSYALATACPEDAHARFREYAGISVGNCGR